MNPESGPEDLRLPRADSLLLSIAGALLCQCGCLRLCSSGVAFSAFSALSVRCGLFGRCHGGVVVVAVFVLKRQSGCSGVNTHGLVSEPVGGF